MKSFITLAALLAASVPSIFASEPLRPETSVANGTTSTLNAAAASSTNACGVTPEVCLSCDNQNITDASGASYTVYCASMINSTDRYTATNANATGTYRLCMQACDDFSGCLGAYYSTFGDCILATGTFSNLVQAEGYTAFRKVVVSSSSTRTHSTTTKLPISTTSLLFPSVTGTVASATSGGSTNMSSSCQATAISCPSCDGKVVTDDRGKSYTVYCDNQLFADSDCSIQRWASPQGCLAECDTFTWCKGSTFWPQGNCELAKGSNVFPQLMPGYTAFLPIASVGAATIPQTSPSRYPTGIATSTRSKTRTSTRSSSRAAMTFSTVTLSGPSATPTSGCIPSAARCPACDGFTVTDKVNQTYSITCASEPICQYIVEASPGGTNTSQELCRENCDADPICFVALWNDGHCDLCEGAIDGLIAADAPTDYVVFLAELASSTTSAAHAQTFITAPAPSSTAVSTTATLSSLSVTASPLTSSSTSSTPPSTTVVSITATLSSLSVTASPPTSSSASFVPPLTDGSVSFATTGGQTRAVV